MEKALRQSLMMSQGEHLDPVPADPSVLLVAGGAAAARAALQEVQRGRVQVIDREA
jgi:hypothetical protein